MVLTIDLSNSYITLGGVVDGRVMFSCDLTSVKFRTPDEYCVLMGLMLERHHVDCQKLEGCILSSVVPELTLSVRRAAEMLTGISPMVVGPGVKTGLNIRLDDPSELGSDFVAASLAAQARYPLPVATVAMDTAMGIGVTDASGAYIGGVIAPGVMISTSALSSRASLLHNVVPQAPGHIICKSTDESMRSGIIYGAAAMLDGLLTGIDEELGQPVTVVATGVWAEAVIPHCRRKGIHLDKDLIHEGLWFIWNRNQRKK
ncbi:MAG: type III pantothenate kinase [Oscillospiraceae bacterium]|nr:type III pantothenate kinase [Oscillospiraceae bacterium]